MSDITPRMHPLALVSLAELDRANRLLADYLADAPAINQFFAHRPEDGELLAAVGARTARRELGEALTAYAVEIGCAPASVENARRLADPATPVVTVGQQPGLLGGPIYTLYKALTAINQARHLTEKIGRPVVPVFWFGADDDDRDEIDHVGCWDGQERLHSIRYTGEFGEPGMLVGDLPAGEAGERVLAQLAELLDGAPFADEVMALYRETLDESRDMGGWFARILARLLSPLGLVFCDPRQPAVRRLAAAVIAREIRAPLATTELVNAQAQALHAAGYHPLLTKPHDLCNFFLLLDGWRRRVRYDGVAFQVETQAYSGEELLDWLAREPERFIPNAVLRPVVQEALFASAAFIAGPNELGYWAELRPVFAALGVEMPPVMPRTGATLVPATQAGLLRKWQIHPLSLYVDYDLVRYAVLEQDQPPAAALAFEQGRVTIEHLVAELSATVAQVDPTLAQSALATHQRMLNELERLERKMLKAVERHQDAHRDGLRHLREVLFPRHGLQERTLGLPSVLARIGLDLPEQLSALFADEESRHLFIEIG